jgi:hypothetical protein
MSTNHGIPKRLPRERSGIPYLCGSSKATTGSVITGIIQPSSLAFHGTIFVPFHNGELP